MNAAESTLREHLIELWPYFKRLWLYRRIIFVPVFVLMVAIAIMTNLPETGLSQGFWPYSVFGLWAFFLAMIWIHAVVLYPYFAPALNGAEKRYFKTGLLLFVPGLLFWGAIYHLLVIWTDSLVVSLDVQLRIIQFLWFAVTWIAVAIIVLIVSGKAVFGTYGRNIWFFASLLIITTGLFPTWLVALVLFLMLMGGAKWAYRSLGNLWQQTQRTQQPKEVRWD